MIFNPPADMEIRTGDFLIVMGEQQNLQNFEGIISSSPAETKRLWNRFRDKLSS